MISATKFEGECRKVFGSSKAPAGEYTIAGADLFKRSYTLNNETKDYASLEVLVEGSEFTIPLNGCWRSRRAADGKAHKASGTFFDELFAKATGKTFDEVVKIINDTLKGRKININYVDYPNDFGFGSVPVINFVEKKGEQPFFFMRPKHVFKLLSLFERNMRGISS